MSVNAILNMNRHEIYANKKLDWKNEWKKNEAAALCETLLHIVQPIL